MRDIRVLCLLVIAALLSACVGNAPHPATLERETVTYRCGGDTDIAVVYSGRATGMAGTAELVWEGHSFALKQDLSGSGARYTDGTLTLFMKGDDAFVEKAGETILKDCLAKTAS